MKLIINGQIIENASQITEGVFHIVQNNTFSNYQPVYYSGATWALARANAVNTMAMGIAVNVTSTSFDFIYSGFVNAIGHGLTAGWNYTSEAVAGTLTVVPPTIYSNPVLFVVDANNFFLDVSAWKITPEMAFKDLTDGIDYSTAGSELKIFRVKADRTGLELVANSPTIPDPLDMTRRTAKPAAPASGYANLYPIIQGGKTYLALQNNLDDDYLIQESICYKDLWMLSPNETTTLNKIGGSFSASGALTHVLDALGNLWWNQVTAATANQTIGISYGAAAGSLAKFAIAKGFKYFARIVFPDADYGTGATGFRFIAGFSVASLSTTVGSNNYAGERVMFAYSTSLAGDTNLMFSTRDVGGTESRVSTGVPFVATHIYEFHIYCAPGGSTIYYRVKDVTADVDSGELSTTLNLPNTATFLYCGYQLCTLDNVARITRANRLYVTDKIGV